MQIITLLKASLKKPVIVVMYGPCEIPPGHFLYDRNVHRHGTYTRNLILSDKLVIRFIIFRFRELLPPGSNRKSITYSLLPFSISPFQRHANTTIDAVLESFFFEHKSKFSIASALDIGISTVRRWIEEFASRAEVLDKSMESRLAESKPGYRPAARPVHNIFDTVRSIFRKAFILAEEKHQLLDFGVTSWLNLKFQS